MAAMGFIEKKSLNLEKHWILIVMDETTDCVTVKK